MPTYYVYAPKGGLAIALDCYCGKKCANNTAISCGQSGSCNSPCGCPGADPNCGKCNHVIVGSGFCCPIDINGSTNDVIRFFASNNVESIKIQYEDGTICLTDTGDIDNGIRVLLYSCPDAVSVGYIGEVIYGHLKNRGTYVSPGQVINRGGTTWASKMQGLGQLPACCGTGCTSGFCGCYGSVHTHMSCKGGTRNSMTCGVTNLTTSSIVYNWTKSSVVCPA